MRSNLAAVVLVVLGTAMVLAATWDQTWTPMRCFGLILLVPSAALWIAARFQLGSSFAVGPEARNLVMRGLYSRIQNPIYLFGSLTTIGLILILNKPWYLLIFVVLIPVQIVRIRRERAVLLARFGEDYLEYQRKTWF